jgi:hypothetical protein
MTTLTVAPAEPADAALARRLWAPVEAVHVPVYFAPSVRAALEGLGLSGRMACYAASRAAPMGAVGPEVVTAAFHGFAPRLVASVVPAVWSHADPADVITTTLEAAEALLTDALAAVGDDVATALPLLVRVATAHPIDGRPLGAAWAGVAWTGRPIADLWLAATRVRESRGDGHVACLTLAGLDGVTAHLTLRGDDPALRERLSGLRGWTDDEFEAGAARLRARGLLDVGGALTPEGVALRADVEEATDALVAPAWGVLDAREREDLTAALDRIAAAIAATGALPSIVTRHLTL